MLCSDLQQPDLEWRKKVVKCIDDGEVHDDLFENAVKEESRVSDEWSLEDVRFFHGRTRMTSVNVWKISVSFRE